MKNNFICLDCHCQFEITRKHEVSDYTGFAGIIIDVCPICISNHIQETKGLFLPILDQEDCNHIERISSYFKTLCLNQKFLVKDTLLMEHYTALIMQTDFLIKKIKDAQQKI
jgi:hypothetical protein